MTCSNEHELSISDWYKWIEQVKKRNDAVKGGNLSHLGKMKSKTLVFDNMRHVYGPMVIGFGKVNSKRRTLWFLDVTKDNPFELELRDRTRTWAVMRMEFTESRLAVKQTDNMGLYDGLSLSEHFIKRLFERNSINSKMEYVNIVQRLMAGIVRLDTKNLAEDLLLSECNELGLVTELGVFFALLENYNSSGRMILKTFISFEEMSGSKKSRFLKLLEGSKLYKNASLHSRFAVISSRSKDGNYEVYNDFVNDYVVSEKYTPPKAVYGKAK